ncbi:hypothetical protein AB0E01_18165 [Nocardia vinacea]
MFLETMSGVDTGELARVATAGVYVRGLMLDGKRKSMQPMAQVAGGRSSAVAAVRHYLSVGCGASAENVVLQGM